MDATTLHARLTAPAALDRLVELSLDALLAQRLDALLPTPWVVRALRTGLRSWAESPQSLALLSQWVSEAVSLTQAETRSLKALTPGELRHAMREVVARPFSPDRRLVLALIDREPTRELVRQLLVDALLEFGRRVSAPVAGVAKGLGSLAKLATDTVKSRSGGLGSLMGAVSGEVERQLEKRAVEFADAALAGIFGKIADALADPRRAAEAAELRLAFFDGVFELTGAQLSRELVNADLPGAAQLVREALVRWLASPAADPHLEFLAQSLAIEGLGEQTVGQVLERLGVLPGARGLIGERLRFMLEGVAQSPAFLSWLGEMMGSAQVA